MEGREGSKDYKILAIGKKKKKEGEERGIYIQLGRQKGQKENKSMRLAAGQIKREWDGATAVRDEGEDAPDQEEKVSSWRRGHQTRWANEGKRNNSGREKSLILGPSVWQKLKIFFCIGWMLNPNEFVALLNLL